MKELIKDVFLVVVGGIAGIGIYTQTVHANQPTFIPQPAPVSYQQRFVQIQQPKDMIGVPLGILALDTKSGTICRTYDAKFWPTVSLCPTLVE